LQLVDDARTDVLRVDRGHGFFVSNRLHAHARVGAQVDVRAASRPDDRLNGELVVDQVIFLQGAAKFSLEGRTARASEEVFDVESIFRIDTLKPWGTRTGMAMLQLLRSKLLPDVPPTATWYLSNNKLKDVASGLKVADTEPSGQPVPPYPGTPRVMPSAAKTGALSTMAANNRTFFFMLKLLLLVDRLA